MSDETRAAAFVGDAPAAALQSALPDRRELGLVAVERTRMPMVITDPRQPDNPIVLANQAFLDLTGYTADEVVGRNCRFLQGPETSPEDLAELKRALAEDGDLIEVELLNYRKDGSSFWNQLGISSVHDEDGRLIYYFASQKDVTARRRAEALEATERLLLKEVDHRAMNALALVQSIVRLTRADDVSSYRRSVLSRVDALARAHRLLSLSGWTGASLAELIELETPEHLKHRMTVDGPSPTLSAQLVQPLTLVLHELTSNALLHGSLCRDGGVVAVHIERGADGIVLRWQESAAPREMVVPQPGFGLGLVRGVIERQLGGKLVMDWRPEGLAARLTLPGRGEDDRG